MSSTCPIPATSCIPRKNPCRHSLRWFAALPFRGNWFASVFTGESAGLRLMPVDRSVSREIHGADPIALQFPMRCKAQKPEELTIVEAPEPHQIANVLIASGIRNRKLSSICESSLNERICLLLTSSLPSFSVDRTARCGGGGHTVAAELRQTSNGVHRSGAHLAQGR